jgi:DNA-binding response OmpR family regulator
LKGFILVEGNPLSVLIIEGKRGNHDSFADGLNDKSHIVNCVPSGKAGLSMMDSITPHVVVVDAASLRTSGTRICQSFRKMDNELPIILIVEKNTQLPEIVDANLVLKLPFTVQKLTNRLSAYQPTDDKYILKVGPIELNTQTQLVTCQDRQKKLTPRLVAILKILMKKKGVVVKREPLFKEVWKTSYTGDTRTLDVHISWLRNAIEEDSSNPQFIQTIRGVGYILDV